MYQYIKVENQGALGYLILNRPDKLNAFNSEILSEIDMALDEFERNTDIKVIIIKGEGKAFSVGMDLSRYGGVPGNIMPINKDRMRLQSNLKRWLRIWEFPKPVIAQVHGYCIAAGSQLAIMCDLTIVSDDVLIGVPAIPAGAGYVAPLWNWFVGPKKAKEVAFRPGSKITAEEAVDLGFANHSFPIGLLDEKTKEIALDIAKVPSDFLSIEKEAINRQMEIQGFRAGILPSAEWDAISHVSEGPQYWLDKVEEIGLKETIELYNNQEIE